MIRVLLLLDSILFVTIGFLYIFSVEKWAAWVGVSLDSPRALIDFRATYGGLDLAVGIFFLLGFFLPEYQKPALLAATLVFAAFMCVRGAGLLLNGYDDRMLYLWAIEIVLTAVNAFYLFRS